MGFKKQLLSVLTAAVFIISFAGFVNPLSANSVATLPQEHNHIEDMIYHIDQQIDSMTRLKNYYMAKSVRYRNRATRIHFQDNDQMDGESDKLVKQANEYDKIVNKLNHEIVKLENQKRKLEKKLPDSD